jgi:chromosome segregation ATPase
MTNLSNLRLRLISKYRSELDKVEQKKILYNSNINIVEGKIRNIANNRDIVLDEIRKLETQIGNLLNDKSTRDEKIRRLQQQLARTDIDSLKAELKRLVEKKDQLLSESSKANRESQITINQLEDKLKDLKLRRDGLNNELVILNQQMQSFAAQREQLVRELNKLISDCKAKFELLREFTNEFEVRASLR